MDTKTNILHDPTAEPDTSALTEAYVLELEAENFGILADHGIYKDYPAGECVNEISELFVMLSSYIQQYGHEYPFTASLHNAIARHCVRLRQYKMALFHFMLARDIRERMYGENHPDVAASFYFIAGAHYLLKEYATAACWLEKELAVSETLPDALPSEKEITCQLLAKLYGLAGEQEKASEWQKKAG